MTTKHKQLLDYIESLPIGDKISVRTIARDLAVSEGTAYRAIKEAENQGLVATIERVGTIRIERQIRTKFETLTFSELVAIIDGQVLGGEAGLSKQLDKFIIGAMTPDAMASYITPRSLMIVGNREDVQRLALSQGAAVLITGGFQTSEEIIALADELAMPILQTTFDTFSVATTINRALADQVIKKELSTVGDLYLPLNETATLLNTQTVIDFKKQLQQTHHSRFPVVNKAGRLLGVVTMKDVLEKSPATLIEKVMTKDPMTVKRYMSVASVGHAMIWNGLEVLPVVSDDLILEGIITRDTVIKNMQESAREPLNTETLFDQVSGAIEGVEIKGETAYRLEVTPQMTNTLGAISFGVLSEAVSTACQRILAKNYQQQAIIEQVNLHYLKLIQLESIIEILPKVLDIGRRSAKLDVDITIDQRIVAKAIVTCQLLERA